MVMTLVTVFMLKLTAILTNYPFLPLVLVILKSDYVFVLKSIPFWFYLFSDKLGVIFLSYVSNNPTNISIEQDEQKQPPNGWNGGGVFAAEGERTRPSRTAHPQPHWSVAIPNTGCFCPVFSWIPILKAWAQTGNLIHPSKLTRKIKMIYYSNKNLHSYVNPAS